MDGNAKPVVGLVELMEIAAEGAVDHLLGRPRAQGRYHPYYNRDRAEAWLVGWDVAQWLLEERGQTEATRWLETL